MVIWILNKHFYLHTKSNKIWIFGIINYDDSFALNLVLDRWAWTLDRWAWTLDRWVSTLDCWLLPFRCWFLPFRCWFLPFRWWVLPFRWWFVVFFCRLKVRVDVRIWARRIARFWLVSWWLFARACGCTSSAYHVLKLNWKLGVLKRQSTQVWSKFENDKKWQKNTLYWNILHKYEEWL